MTEELFASIFNYVYIPFSAAIVLICGYFWRSHEKIKNNVANIDDRLDEAVTQDQVEAMIDSKFEILSEGQKNQTEVLKEISKSITSANIINARMDERMKTIEATIERRSEIRAKNS